MNLKFYFLTYLLFLSAVNSRYIGAASGNRNFQMSEGVSGMNVTQTADDQHCTGYYFRIFVKTSQNKSYLQILKLSER